ncbi:MAG: hypothetical protein V5789_09580 [Colwellia sp.]
MLENKKQNNDQSSVATCCTDKRQNKYSKDCMWDKLNFSQQYAVCCLGQFGYQLTYVRSIAGHNLAVLKYKKKIATVNSVGDININPSIKCR